MWEPDVTDPAKRRSSFDTWSDRNCDKGERLLAFETWVAQELATRLIWPTETKAMQRQVGQCRSFVLQAVADMGNHGFLFQPKELAKMIVEVLNDLRARQDKGEIQELYAYFRITWQSYVRGRAEELKSQAMALGSHISQSSSQIDSMTTLVEQDQVERIRDKKAAARKRQKRRSQPTAIGDLFDGLDPSSN